MALEILVVLWYGFLTATFLLPTIIFFFKKTRRNLPPGPVAFPIIGHLHLVGAKLHHSFDKLSRRYGPLFHLQLGSIPCLVVSTPEMAKEFLKTNELVFSSRKNSSAVSILTHDVSFAFSPYGTYWKLIKKLCTQELLRTKNLDHFQSIRTLELHRFLDHLMKKAKGGEIVNVSEEILNLTNDVISQMMISVRCSDTKGDAKNNARTVIREVTQIFGEVDVSDIIWFCKNFDLQGIKKRAEDINERYDLLLEKIISDRERARSLKQKEEKDQNTNDFLDILLNAMEDDMTQVKLTRSHIKALILVSKYALFFFFSFSTI